MNYYIFVYVLSKKNKFLIFLVIITYLATWEVRALMIIDYWSKCNFYFLCHLSFFRVYLIKNAQKGYGSSKINIQELLILYTIGENLHFTSIRSSFVKVVTLPFHPPFNLKHTNAFHWKPWYFCLCIMKAKFLICSKYIF